MRIFLQKLAEFFVDDRFDHALHFRGHEFVLGLGRELWVRNLDRQHGGQAFARVVAADFDFLFFGEAGGFDIAIERAGHGGAQAGQVGAAVALRNVVGVAEDVLLVGVVPLHGQLNGDVGTLGRDVNHLGVQRGLVTVEVLHEGGDAALVLEHVFLHVAVVAQNNAHAGVEKRQLTQALGQQVVVHERVAENLRARLEMHAGAGFGAVADNLERRDRYAHPELLVVDFSAAPDRDLELLRQGVDHGNADPVQPARNLVGVVIELAAGV